jgi:putative oxygen-independent coproporphyrinogen III oxidase
MGGFSLYVHIPYCQAKCPYCDFNSYAASRWPEAEYVAALDAELAHYAAAAPWRGGVVRTVFFGGGTPSLFAPASIAGVLEEVERRWPIADGAEITLEANPGTVSGETLGGFRQAGVNRVSFGVQSFAAHHLRTLGRIHGAAEAEAAVGLARAAGFTDVSLDLIFALPGQTLAEWESDLRRACALGPDHVSAYNLTYEEGTPFHRWRLQGRLHSLPEETEVAMLTRAEATLGAAGYARYEISNYGRPGHACRHNLNYWRSGAYLGVGAGAHSYAPAHREPGWGRRWSNERQPSAYLRSVAEHGHARCAIEELDARQARGEFVFLGLRCLEGVDAACFTERFGVELITAFPQVEALRHDGLLEDVAGHWRLTPRGLLLADSVFATFL